MQKGAVRFAEKDRIWIPTENGTFRLFLDKVTLPRDSTNDVISISLLKVDKKAGNFATRGNLIRRKR